MNARCQAGSARHISRARLGRAQQRAGSSPLFRGPPFFSLCLRAPARLPAFALPPRMRRGFAAGNGPASGARRMGVPRREQDPFDFFFLSPLSPLCAPRRAPPHPERRVLRRRGTVQVCAIARPNPAPDLQGRPRGGAAEEGERPPRRPPPPSPPPPRPPPLPPHSLGPYGPWRMSPPSPRASICPQYLPTFSNTCTTTRLCVGASCNGAPWPTQSTPPRGGRDEERREKRERKRVKENKRESGAHASVSALERAFAGPRLRARKAPLPKHFSPPNGRRVSLRRLSSLVVSDSRRWLGRGRVLQMKRSLARSPNTLKPSQRENIRSPQSRQAPLAILPRRPKTPFSSENPPPPPSQFSDSRFAGDRMETRIDSRCAFVSF